MTQIICQGLASGSFDPCGAPATYRGVKDAGWHAGERVWMTLIPLARVVITVMREPPPCVASYDRRGFGGGFQ
jgi:hypothetical protein